MKRIVCAACGLVNLEKFLSFPHCAACGALLPQRQPARWRVFWRRPIPTLYFALAIGGGLSALAVGVISIARETRVRVGKPLLVYARLPRTLAPGQIGVASLTLDSAEENPDANFEGVQLRLGRDTLRDLSVVAIKPPPKRVEVRGNGRYYGWDALPRGTQVQLSFKARKPNGNLRLRATLGATDYVPFEARATIAQTPSTPASGGQGAPKVGSYNK